MKNVLGILLVNTAEILKRESKLCPIARLGRFTTAESFLFCILVQRLSIWFSGINAKPFKLVVV